MTSWGRLGASNGRLEGVLHVLGRSWGMLGSSSRRLEAFWERLGGVIVLGPFGSFLGRLGASWRHLEVLFILKRAESSKMQFFPRIFVDFSGSGDVLSK